MVFQFKFKILSQNYDGKLTREEFKIGSKKDPWIVQALTMETESGTELASADVSPRVENDHSSGAPISAI